MRPPRPPEFTRADAEAVRKLTADFVAAFDNEDLDAVLEFYTEAAVFMPPSRDRGKYLFVMSKGAWKFDYTMWSSDLPPPAASK